MSKKVTTTLSDEFHKIATDFNIQWSEALRVGLAVLFLERGVPSFENPLNIQRIKFLAERVGLKINNERSI